MWDELPLDLLSRIFSFLPPDALLRAMSACKHWRCASAVPATVPAALHHPWLLAMPTRGRAESCYARNPATQRWHSLHLNFARLPLRLLAPLRCGLLLCRHAAAASLRLALCNPFARQLCPLPDLRTLRRNPAVAVVPAADAAFRVYVAGGTAAAGSYEPTVEVFDSRDGRWTGPRPMPAEVAVRLTVWTPDEGVHAGGTVYWMTSARAYSVVGLELGSGAWREVRAPMAERLEWAALVRRGGGRRLGLVGGTHGGECLVWELGEEDVWALVCIAPAEIREKLSRVRRGSRWTVVGSDGEDRHMYLLRDQLGADMLVGREVAKCFTDSDEEQQQQQQMRWEWSWVQSHSGSVGGDDHEGVMPNVPIKAVLLHPTLSSLPCIS